MSTATRVSALDHAMQIAHVWIRDVAREATIAPNDVGKAAAVTTAAALRHLPAAQVDKALAHLPPELRAVLQPPQ